MNAEELTEEIKRDGHSPETALVVMLGICLFAMPIFAARPCCHSACRKYAVRHGHSHAYSHAYRHYPSHRYHAGSYCCYDPYSYYGVTLATPVVVVEEPLLVRPRGSGVLRRDLAHQTDQVRRLVDPLAQLCRFLLYYHSFRLEKRPL